MNNKQAFTTNQWTLARPWFETTTREDDEKKKEQVQNKKKYDLHNKASSPRLDGAWSNQSARKQVEVKKWVQDFQDGNALIKQTNEKAYTNKTEPIFLPAPKLNWMQKAKRAAGDWLHDIGQDISYAFTGKKDAGDAIAETAWSPKIWIELLEREVNEPDPDKRAIGILKQGKEILERFQANFK